jgi:sulfur-oxidizing protein SoxX
MKTVAGIAVSVFTWIAIAPMAGALAQSASAPGATAASLVVFQVTEQNGVPAIVKPLTDKPGDPKEGAKVVVNRRLGNCLSCHQIGSLKSEEFHGEVGPALDGAGARWDAATLRMILVDPKKVFTDETVMPGFYRVSGLNRVRAEFQGKPILTAQQIEDVVAFLTTLK